VHSVKPKRGIRVAVDGLPGTWIVLDPAPTRGSWWVQAADEAAKAHRWAEEAHGSRLRRPEAVA
jgi:hypothetical protein